MPVKVKLMDPEWVASYAALPPTDEQQEQVKKALKDYTDETNASATKLNKKLEEITGIDL